MYFHDAEPEQKTHFTASDTQDDAETGQKRLPEPNYTRTVSIFCLVQSFLSMSI